MGETRQNWRVLRLKLHMALLAARRQSGRTQEEVACATGCSVRNFQRFENGEAEPSADELFRWGDAVGVSIGFSVLTVMENAE